MPGPPFDPRHSDDPLDKRLRVARPAFDEVATRYAAGESILALSRAYGVTRDTVGRWLDRVGVERRDRSEANRVRMARLSPEERAALAAPAHDAVRGRRRSDDELARRAASALRAAANVRLGEGELSKMLGERGVITEAQRPVGKYNLDLAAWPVAVEVHRRTSHPARAAALRERSVHLTDAGWRVLYVWCATGARTRGLTCFSERCADEIVAHVQRAQADPASVREYRVIRCTGEDAP